jgi:hypothetical protein
LFFTQINSPTPAPREHSFFKTFAGKLDLIILARKMLGAGDRTACWGELDMDKGVLLAVLAVLSSPAFAAVDDLCELRCKAALAACDKANCLPGRLECAAKCTDPKYVRCRADCITKFEPCTKSCTETCVAACGASPQ